MIDPSTDLPAEIRDRLFTRTRGGAARDPARTRRLLDALGVPDPRHVVHVVGTNGKGSVTWRVDAGLRAAGLRSLRFLSPHVERMSERIAVDGRPVTPDEAASFLERAWSTPEGEAAAFFELCTAMALDVADRRGATWAVLEAGVGAAHDATLAVGGVRAVVITNVALDHLDAIGPDLAAVARDKAEAIRPGVPVVTAARGEPLRIVRELAQARGAPLWVHGTPATTSDAGSGSGSGSGSAEADGTDEAGAEARNAGGGVSPFGSESAALARAVLERLDLPVAGRPAALAAAAEPPALPARRETFRRGSRSVLLDGAHNAAAAEFLARDLPAGHDLLLGVLSRKDPPSLLRILSAKARRVGLTAAEPGESPWGSDERFEPDAERALALALEALPEDGLLVVAGSFHLAGRLRPLLRAWAVSPADRADASSARTRSRR